MVYLVEYQIYNPRAWVLLAPKFWSVANFLANLLNLLSCNIGKTPLAAMYRIVSTMCRPKLHPELVFTKGLSYCTVISVPCSRGIKNRISGLSFTRKMAICFIDALY